MKYLVLVFVFIFVACGNPVKESDEVEKCDNNNPEVCAEKGVLIK